MFLDFLFCRFRENRDKIAIIWKNKEYSYNWLLKEIDTAKSFLNKNKIKIGDIVAIRSDFNPYSIAFLLASIENCNIIVPLSYAAKNRDEFYKIAEVEFAVEVGGDNKKILKKFKKKKEVRHNLLSELQERKHPGLILFSSGSTGKSKASVHDFVSLLNKFKLKRHTLRAITFLLFDHIGGINTMFYLLSNVGTIVASMDRNVGNICKLIEKYQVELLPTSPTFLNMILISRAFEKYSLSSLKIVTYGTEPMPEYVLSKFHHLFPNIQLKQTYGLSELGIMRSSSKSSDSLWVKIGGEGYQTKIVNGVLWIKTEMAMLGYLNAPSPFDEEGWFNTQDRVERDGEWIKILGRESEIINVGGQKTYPAEVESVLLELDNIAEVSVYTKPNPIMGNVVAARICLLKDETLVSLKGRIRSYCKSRLESYKIPAFIEISKEKQITDRFKKVR